MLDILLLRIDAPMIAFGTTIVDNHGEVQPFPALSMLTGLLGNALGLEHRDIDLLQALQSRIRYAVRCDRPGQLLNDYHTVDLGQPFMACEGWTTRGEVQKRKGETRTNKGTHIRFRKYWIDSVYTVALTLDPPHRDAKDSPSLSDVERALVAPYRPLFLGRKTCLPAEQIFLGRRTSSSLLDCLRDAPSLPSDRVPRNMNEYSVWWFDPEDQADKLYREVPVCDERDWANQIHVGSRLVFHGCLNIPKEATDGTQ